LVTALTAAALLAFSGGTTATMDGQWHNSQSICMCALREFTIGPDGSVTMPALRLLRGYTTLWFSVPTEAAAGARAYSSLNRHSVRRELLGYPVGGVVPAGYYDCDRVVWFLDERKHFRSGYCRWTGGPDIDGSNIRQ
jgi:hypothetical protein